MAILRGRHFLQIPGPTNVPERILRALSKPTIDHRGPEFAQMTREIISGLQEICKTTGRVVIYPSSGTGGWEAALVNTHSPGDKVLIYETGFFANMWRSLASKIGLQVEFLPGDWRRGVEVEL
ncbi:MAG: serine--glyoxylate aminotransferase, partial [bacterium]